MTASEINKQHTGTPKKPSSAACQSNVAQCGTSEHTPAHCSPSLHTGAAVYFDQVAPRPLQPLHSPQQEEKTATPPADRQSLNTSPDCMAACGLAFLLTPYQNTAWPYARASCRSVAAGASCSRHLCEDLSPSDSTARHLTMKAPYHAESASTWSMVCTQHTSAGPATRLFHTPSQSPHAGNGIIALAAKQHRSTRSPSLSWPAAAQHHAPLGVLVQ